MIEGVDLDQFVKDTLLAIVRGVATAQQDEELGQHVAPRVSGAPSGRQSSQGLPIQNVHFDVAASASKSTSAGGGMAVKVLPLFAVQGDGKGQHESSTVSRISFDVPVSLPESRPRA